MKTFRPLFFITAMILVVGLACGASGGDTPEVPVQPQQDQPQDPHLPAQDDPQSTQPPQAEEPSGSMYFTEEFDQDPGWRYFLTSGEDKTDFIKIEIINGNLIKFQVESGSGPLGANVRTTGSLSDDEWHSVHVETNR